MAIVSGGGTAIPVFVLSEATYIRNLHAVANCVRTMAHTPSNNESLSMKLPQRFGMLFMGQGSLIRPTKQCSSLTHMLNCGKGPCETQQHSYVLSQHS